MKGHLDELHDQEQLTRRLVHLDQLDDAGVSHPPQHRHFVFYQMLLFSHTRRPLRVSTLSYLTSEMAKGPSSPSRSSEPCR